MADQQATETERAKLAAAETTLNAAVKRLHQDYGSCSLPSRRCKLEQDCQTAYDEVQRLKRVIGELEGKRGK